MCQHLVPWLLQHMTKLRNLHLISSAAFNSTLPDNLASLLVSDGTACQPSPTWRRGRGMEWNGICGLDSRLLCLPVGCRLQVTSCHGQSAIQQTRRRNQTRSSSSSGKFLIIYSCYLLDFFRYMAVPRNGAECWMRMVDIKSSRNCTDMRENNSTG